LLAVTDYRETVKFFLERCQRSPDQSQTEITLGLLGFSSLEEFMQSASLSDEIGRLLEDGIVSIALVNPSWQNEIERFVGVVSPTPSDEQVAEARSLWLAARSRNLVYDLSSGQFPMPH